MTDHLSSRNPKKSFSIWLGLGLAIALDTAIQIIWKSAVSNVPASLSPWDTVFVTVKQPLCQVTFVLFIIQFINWMTVLAKANLSYSQPITALSLVTVTGMSFLLLNENIPPLRLAGMILILAGVWFISMTDHRTLQDARPIEGKKHER